jgi:tRNA (mo5U34)-methyltransferase
MALRRIVELGGVGLALAVDDRLARKVRSSVLWRGAKDRAAPAAPAASNGTRAAASDPRVDSPAGRTLRDRMSGLNWYHTIEIGEGVVTPGEFDHRPYLAHYPIPARLDGMRALDVATFDGYWAFEFERRGAAEVVALDVGSIAECDLQPRLRSQVDPGVLGRVTGAGFNFAKEALGSRVQREVLSVYDLSPARVGLFDFVFCGDLLLHLMNPVTALERIRSVLRGEAILVDAYSPHLPGKTAEYRGGVNRCVWWSFSLGCLEQMIADAGFGDVTLLHTFRIGHRGERPWMWRAAFRARP